MNKAGTEEGKETTLGKGGLIEHKVSPGSYNSDFFYLCNKLSLVLRNNF